MDANHDSSPLNELLSSLYADLRQIAARHLRKERSDHTLQTTALVHEAYLRLSDDARTRFTGRTHFLALASRVMRQVLVDHARARATQKRGRGERREWTTRLAVQEASEPVDLLDLDRALDALARKNELLAQLIEMRYFGGMTAEETAAALGRSVHVVRHDLRLAQAWLRRELSA